MKKNKIIFFIVFALFHLFLVFFTTYVDAQKNDFSFLSKMLRLVPLTKYGAIFGLMLLIIDIIWSFISEKKHDNEKKALHQEINVLKAKMFDLQETNRNSSSPPANSSTKL